MIFYSVGLWPQEGVKEEEQANQIYLVPTILRLVIELLNQSK
jgi:hypothetical protein